jgi:hypothetical protein
MGDNVLALKVTHVALGTMAQGQQQPGQLVELEKDKEDCPGIHLHPVWIVVQTG